MTALREAIRAVYEQVSAPEWAAPNLDALTDVLRDLSWLPEGDVVVGIPVVDGVDEQRLLTVLERAVRDSTGGPHPVVLSSGGPHPAVLD